MFSLISRKFGFANENSLRLLVFKRRATTGELYRSLWKNHGKNRLEPHITGIRSWRVPAIKASIQVGIIVFLCLINSLLLANNIQLLNFDSIPVQYISNGDYRAIWQAHAAIISITFIAIVFLYEFISDEDTSRFGARVVVTDTRGIQIISFSVLANGVMAVSSVLLPQDGATVPQSNAVLFGTLRTAVPLLFFLTLLLVLFLYGRISSLMLDEGIGDAVERRGKSGIDVLMESNTPREVEMEILQEYIPGYPESQYSPRLSGTRIQGDQVNMDGEISDLNLWRLQQVFHLAKALDTEIRQAPRLGDTIGQRSLLTVSKDLDWAEEALFTYLLEEAIVTSQSTRWNDV